MTLRTSLIHHHIRSLRESTGSGSEYYDWSAKWIVAIPERKYKDPEILKVLADLLDRRTAAVFLKGKSLSDLRTLLKCRRERLISRLVRHEPDLLCQILRESWKPETRWEDKTDSRPPNTFAVGILFAADASLADRLACSLGYEVGRYCEGKGLDPIGPDLVTSFLDSHKVSYTVVPPVVGKQATLWALIRRIARYTQRSWEHRTELLGTESQLLRFASHNPEEWARALPSLIAHSKRVSGVVESVTVAVHDVSSEVRDSLKQFIQSAPTADIRDRTRGLQALCAGLSRIEEEVSLSLLSHIARHSDGITLFPHPLELRSATWLGSLTVEDILRRSIQEAERHFQNYFDRQGPVVEEAPTAVLLNEMEVAFRNQTLSLRALGEQVAAETPRVVLSQMQVTKNDEAVYGCDIAFVLRGVVPGALNIESAELVQVKKPERLSTPSRRRSHFKSSWRITVGQLEDILKYSQTAVYWLILPNGQVLAVPARLLLAIADGSRRRRQGSVTVWYSQVRSQAIGLSQFLVDLFVGVWLGRSEVDIIRFARGQLTKTRPRHIVEIEVQYGKGG